MKRFNDGKTPSNNGDQSPKISAIDLSKPQHFYVHKSSSDTSLSKMSSEHELLQVQKSSERSKSVDISELPEEHMIEEKNKIEKYEQSFDNLVHTYKDKRESDQILNSITDQRKKAKEDYINANHEFKQSFIKLDQGYQKQVEAIVDNLQANIDGVR